MAELKREYRERAVSFGAKGALTGVVTTPAEDAADRPMVIILNAGVIHHVGPNRLHVQLARALADAGVPSLRFDLAGIGDSPPRRDRLSIEFGVLEDIREAVTFMEGRFAGRGFLLFGLCSGANNALRYATDDDRVVGLLLLDPAMVRTLGYWIRHGARRLVASRTWARLAQFALNPSRLRARLSPAMRPGQSEGEREAERYGGDEPDRQAMRETLRRLLARQVQLLYIFTAGLEAQYNYRGQFRAAFRGLPFVGYLRLEYFSRSDHTFSRWHDRKALLNLVVEWTSATTFPAPPARVRPSRQAADSA